MWPLISDVMQTLKIAGCHGNSLKTSMSYAKLPAFSETGKWKFMQMNKHIHLKDMVEVEHKHPQVKD